MRKLETRYRLLLAAYPAAHRQRYQEEMLGTLMESAPPQRLFPHPRETFDLLINAVRWHLRRRDLPRVSDPRWADAGAVFGLLGAVLLAARFVDEQTGALILANNLRTIASRTDDGFSAQLIIDEPLPSYLSWNTFAVAGAWLVIALLAMLAWRRIAAGMAWLMTLALAGKLLYEYPSSPALLAEYWPLLVLSVITAACLTLPAPDRRAAAVLGKTLTAIAFVVTAVVGVLPSIEALQVRRLPWEGGSTIIVNLTGVVHNVPGRPSVIGFTCSAAFAVVMLWLLIKVGRPVRRRLYVLAAPGLLIMEIVIKGFAGVIAMNARAWPVPVMLTVGQWLALLLLPLVAWAAGVLLLRRAETLEASTN